MNLRIIVNIIIHRKIKQNLIDLYIINKHKKLSPKHSLQYQNKYTKTLLYTHPLVKTINR